MDLTGGITEINVHNMRTEEAIRSIKNAVNKAAPSVYRIRVIHGYHGGTRIRDAIDDEFAYGRVNRVKRVARGSNPGITELILREY